MMARWVTKGSNGMRELLRLRRQDLQLQPDPKSLRRGMIPAHVNGYHKELSDFVPVCSSA
jgi:hypothetical protein